MRVIIWSVINGLRVLIGLSVIAIVALIGLIGVWCLYGR
jgi:hypothetical protein